MGMQHQSGDQEQIHLAAVPKLESRIFSAAASAALIASQHPIINWNSAEELSSFSY